MKPARGKIGKLFLIGIIMPLWQMWIPAGGILAEETHSAMKITSTAFKEGERIPRRHTCEGEDLSPPLIWTSAPKGTQSFALIADDPDAPTAKPWVHWIVYNLPPKVRNLPEGIPPLEKLANGEKQGFTDFKRVGYAGPCPPSGTHRYYFKLYALDAILPPKLGATKGDLLTAMQGHVLAEAYLMGKYEKENQRIRASEDQKKNG